MVCLKSSTYREVSELFSSILFGTYMVLDALNKSNDNPRHLSAAQFLGGSFLRVILPLMLQLLISSLELLDNCCFLQVFIKLYCCIVIDVMVAVITALQFVYFKISFFYKLSENSVSILGSRLL